MAGVPLLNGFLSKEMFFEESIVAGGSVGMQFALPVHRHAGSAVQRRVLGALHPRGVLRAAGRRLAARAARAQAHARAERAARRRLRARRHASGATRSGRCSQTAGHAILGADLPAYELAVWHGFTPPLLMSLIALAGGIGFYLLCYLRGRTLASSAAPVAARQQADVRHRERRRHARARARVARWFVLAAGCRRSSC